ncbi:MAG: cupin domain-containing protein [Haloquadratum sp.]
MKVNESDLEWREYDHGDQAFRRKQLSAAVDADDIGCSLYELPPEKRAWPYHYHTGNAEAIYVLAGSGRLRLRDDDLELTAGDYVALPATEEGGHQVVNDTDDTLRYLMVSTMRDPDVTVYPEMGKFGVYAGAAPGGTDDRTLQGYYDIDDEVDYWDDE